MPDPKAFLRSSHGRPIAANANNTITLRTVALGQLSVPRFEPEHPEKPFEIALEPIRGAYVVCVQRTLGGKPVRAFPERFGRTNGLGWMIERDREEVEGPIPQVPVLPEQTLFGEPIGDPMAVPARDQLMLDGGETYELFWSLDAERFEQCCQALAKEPGRFPEAFPTHTLVFREIQPADTRDLELEDQALAHRVGRHLLRTGSARGFICEKDLGVEVGVFDVTAAPLRALYLCEFLQWYTVHKLHKSSPNLAVLVRARNLVEAAHSGQPDFYMDSQFNAAPGTPERLVLDHYRDFVWQCAANGVKRDQVDLALAVTQASLRSTEQPRWHEIAVQIRDESAQRALHPVFREIRPHERLVLDATTQSLLADYCSMYRFGSRLRKRDFAQQVGRETVRLSDIIAANEELKAQLLHAHAKHTLFMEALDRTTLPGDEPQRLELLQRYCEVSADACYAWWEAFDGYTADDWKKYKLRAKWITGVPGGVGKLFKGFFDRQIKAYKLAQDKANAALTTFFRYHAAAVDHRGLQVFEENLPTLKAKVRVDFRANTIAVLEASDGTTELSKPVHFVFTTIVEKIDPEGLERPGGNMSEARKQRFDLAKATGNVVEYDVELPVDVRRARNLGLEVPSALALACNGINTAFAALAAVEELKRGFKLERKNVEAWFELGKNVVGLADSLSAMQEAMLPKVEGDSPLLKRMSSALNKASRSVAVLDSAYNLATGMELLFSDDGAVAYELRQGRAVRAQALRAKGVVQLATAGVGGVMAAGTLAMFGGGSTTGLLALAAGPVGVALAAGGILIIGIDSTLSLTQDFGEQTAALETALDKAERAEFVGKERLKLGSLVERLQQSMQAAKV